MSRLNWTDIAEARHRTEVEKQLKTVYRRINTPFAQSMLGAIENGEVLKKYPTAPDPRQYDNAKRFSKDWLAYQMVRKTDFWDVGIDKSEACKKAFDSCETRMASLNRTFHGDLAKSKWSAAVTLAAQKVLTLIGPAPDIDEVVTSAAFTSGASTRLSRRRGNPGYKLSGKPHCTREAQHLSNLYLYTDPVYMFDKTEVGPIAPTMLTEPVLGSRFDMVPKNFKTHRGIAIEPEMNMFFQRGTGKVLKRFLKRVGIDLSTQSYNQYLALVGSRTGSLVTIDLEAASDSISCVLVEFLLPRKWFEWLDLIRSKRIEIDGEFVKLEKFSSMGNGFTFELETLIFWALTDACRELYGVDDNRVAVYGDDIICHNSYASDLIEVLGLCGFRTNTEKTFLDGPFRESCGKHYFHGIDVTPFNFSSTKGDITDVLLIVNSFNLWCKRNKQDPLRRTGILELAPIVPPSYGLRAGFIQDENPYAVDNNGLFRLTYFSYVSTPKKGPQFGLYWTNLKLGSIEENPLSELVESSGKLVRRKAQRLSSFWD